MKTDVVFWIINIVTKSGNAPFQHFQRNVDNSEAKFPHFYRSAKSRLKSRLPEPTSRLNLNRGRLVRMVYQNGLLKKFERLKKIIQKLRFMQIEKIFSRKLIWCYEESGEATKILVLWAL